jgi:hypothetical protein
MKGLFADAMLPVVIGSAAVYLALVWWLGFDPRWFWALFLFLFVLALWRQGRAAVGVPFVFYLFAYALLVGSGPVSGARGFAATLLPAACLLIQIAWLLTFWLFEHIRHGR